MSPDISSDPYWKTNVQGSYGHLPPPSAFPSLLSAPTELLLGWSELVWASLGHVLGVGGEAEVSGRFGLHKVSYPFASGTQRDPPQLPLFLPIRPTLSNPRLSMIGHGRNHHKYGKYSLYGNSRTLLEAIGTNLLSKQYANLSKPTYCSNPTLQCISSLPNYLP